MAEAVHVGDTGTVFEATIKSAGVAVDLSSAGTLQLIFQKPDGTLLQKTAVYTGNGTDGRIQYVTVAADLTTPGVWHLQGRIVIGTNEWRTNVQTFTVYPNLS